VIEWWPDPEAQRRVGQQHRREPEHRATAFRQRIDRTNSRRDLDVLVGAAQPAAELTVEVVDVLETPSRRSLVSRLAPFERSTTPLDRAINDTRSGSSPTHHR
jgi:hypothetical protein